MRLFLGLWLQPSPEIVRALCLEIKPVKGILHLVEILCLTGTPQFVEFTPRPMKPSLIKNSCLDVRALITATGGSKALYKAFKKHGIKVGISSIYAWLARESLPANRLVHILAVMKREGKTLDITNYVKEVKSIIPKNINEISHQDSGRPSEAQGGL